MGSARRALAGASAVLIASIVLIFGIPQADIDKATYDMGESYDRVCLDGHCRMIIYSYPANWHNESSGEWRKAKKVENVNGTWVQWLEIDPAENVTVFYVKDGRLQVRHNGQVKTYNAEDKRIYKFGKASTTIKIVYTFDTDDAGIWQVYPNTNYGADASMDLTKSASYQANLMVRFNISSIPAGQTIESAYMGVQMYAGYLEAGEWMRVCAYHIYDFPAYNISGLEWKEENVAWINRSSTASQVNSTADYCFNVTDTYSDFSWQNFTVTDSVLRSYNAGFKNVSVYFVPISASINDELGDALRIYTKESATREPYFYVTYTEGAEPPPASTCYTRSGKMMAIPAGCVWPVDFEAIG